MENPANKYYEAGQREHRPMRKFFKKHEKKVRVAESKQKAINKFK